MHVERRALRLNQASPVSPGEAIFIGPTEMTTNRPWSDGYVTHLEYTHGVYREMSPAMIRFALVCSGYAPPSFDREFSYCELGFGQGTGLNLLAATNPNGNFFGTDFNSTHVLNARRLAASAGLTNLSVTDDSFATYARRRDLPDFDVIALHGIYSWISEANRTEVIEFLKARAKPGALVYVSYNCLPGWAPMIPMQWLMNRSMNYATSGGATFTTRIAQSLDLLKRVADQPTGYFAIHKGAKDYLSRVVTQDANYVAHEYLNNDWHPKHFMDVAQELQVARLDYLCSADVGGLIDDLNVSSETVKFLAEIKEPIFRQQLRDFATNTKFRRDLFARGFRKLPPAQREAMIRGTPINLVRPRSRCELNVKTNIGRGELKAALYNPLFDSLAESSKTIDQLVQSPELKHFGFRNVVNAVIAITGIGYGQPGLPELAPKATEISRRMNLALLEDAVANPADAIAHLAAPDLSTGIHVAPLSKLFLAAVQAGQCETPEACAEFAHQRLALTGRQIVQNDRSVSDAGDSLRALTEGARDWISNEVPVLRRLRVPVSLPSLDDSFVLNAGGR